MNNLLNIFRGGVKTYDKSKMTLMKVILPVMIILHHISNEGYSGIRFFGIAGNYVMYIFFAMSGYGLVISYLRNADYINGFLRRSLPKLFIPYLVAMVLYVAYRWLMGIDQVELLRTKGLYSFVPTSWYIYVLSYFYIFFYVIFRFVKGSNLLKVLLVCALVLGYWWIAPRIGVSPWRYERCPAFCIGMLVALGNALICTRMRRWQMMALLALAICYIPLMHLVRDWSQLWYDRLWYISLPYYTAVLFFMAMYIIGSIPTNRVTRFISSISLEMFIIQYLPIYLMESNLGVTSTPVMVCGVLALDIILAYAMHRTIQWLHRPAPARAPRPSDTPA